MESEKGEEFEKNKEELEKYKKIVEKEKRKKILRRSIDVIGVGATVGGVAELYIKTYPILERTSKIIDSGLGAYEALKGVINPSRAEKVLKELEDLNLLEKDLKALADSLSKYSKNLENFMTKTDELIRESGRLGESIKPGFIKKLDDVAEMFYRFFGYKTSPEWKERWDAVYDLIGKIEEKEKISKEIIEEVGEKLKEIKEEIGKENKKIEKMENDLEKTLEVCIELEKMKRGLQKELREKGSKEEFLQTLENYEEKLRAIYKETSALAEKYEVKTKPSSSLPYVKGTALVGYAILGVLAYTKIMRPILKKFKKLLKLC
jgi:DNA repair exonuclease SbcCD ATPase subunit